MTNYYLIIIMRRVLWIFIIIHPRPQKKSFISLSDAASTLDYPTIIPPMSYWDSNEARIFFATRDGETALQSIDNQIEILKKHLTLK